MVEHCEARILGIAFPIERGFLRGREKLGEHEIFSAIRYDA